MAIALNIVIYVLEAVILAVCIFKGYKRGLFNSLIRTIYLAVIIPLSILISNPVAGVLADALVSGLKNIDAVRKIYDEAHEFADLSFVLVRPVVFAFVFASIFTVLTCLSLIGFGKISNGVSNKILKKQPKPAVDKAMGSLFGALNGLAIAAVILIPLCLAATFVQSVDKDLLSGFTGSFTKENEIVRDIPQLKAENKAVPSTLKRVVEKRVVLRKVKYVFVPSSLFLKSVTKVNGKLIPEEFPDLKDEKIYSVEEIPNFINIAGKISVIVSDTLRKSESKTISGVNKSAIVFAAINTVRDTFGNSKVIPSMFMRLMRIAAKAIENGEPLFGAKFEAESELIDGMSRKTMSIIKELDNETLDSVLDTLIGDEKEKDSKGILNDLAVVIADKESQETVKGLLEKHGDVLAESMIEMGKNRDMQSVNTIIAEMGSAYLAENIDSLFPAGSTSNDKKSMILDLTGAVVEELKNHGEEVSGDEYAEYVDAVSTRINNEMEAGDIQYKFSDAEVKIISVGLISAAQELKDPTEESLMAYFGIPDDIIGEIISMK